jgi:MFS family permease
MILGIAGFTAATVMCGFATSLAEHVFWRVVQSAFGSPLTPISQSVVIDEFTKAKRAPALAIYSMGVSIPPTLAPLIGGYVSEQISWRWVFFILVPIALLACIGALTAIKPDPPRDERPKLDWIGFLSLSIAVACIQLMLDRGERAEWFGSMEIIVEALLAVVFGWIFVATACRKIANSSTRVFYLSAILLWESAYLLFVTACMSLQRIAEHLAEARHVNERGKPYNPKSALAMVNGPRPKGAEATA